MDARIIQRKFEILRVASVEEAGRPYAVGHSPIDTAWLWPMREANRKCGRTFSTDSRSPPSKSAPSGSSHK
jgi:alpha-mannosidase